MKGNITRIGVRNVTILDRAEAEWRASLGTNFENHAVSVVRVANTVEVVNEKGERVFFFLKEERR